MEFTAGAQGMWGERSFFMDRTDGEIGGGEWHFLSPGKIILLEKRIGREIADAGGMRNAWISVVMCAVFGVSIADGEMKIVPPPAGIYHCAFPDFGGAEDKVTAERLKKVKSRFSCKKRDASLLSVFC